MVVYKEIADKEGKRKQNITKMLTKKRSELLSFLKRITMEELREKKECNEEKEKKNTKVFMQNSTQTGKHLCIIA